jgi:single-strand DNA-binding protein
VRKTQDGKDLAILSVAVSDGYFDKKTNLWAETDTQWFKAVAFGKREISEANNLKKGSLVNIKGSLRNHKYTDDKGNERSSTEIVISSLEEIVRRKSEGQEAA